MRPIAAAPMPHLDLRRALERLESLPIRSRTALSVLERVHRSELDEPLPPSRPGREAAVDPSAFDPGWVLAQSQSEREGIEADLELVERLPWWRSESSATSEAFSRLWRYSVALTLATRRLALEIRDPEPEQLAAAALLANLGIWAWFSVDPVSAADWLSERNPARCAELERRALGSDHVTLGLRLAEQWGCDPLVADAIWTVHTPACHSNEGGATSGRLSLLVKARELADLTPWSLFTADSRDNKATEPRTRLLIAEVQARCGSAFIDPAATLTEERLARQNALLRIDLAALQSRHQAAERFLKAYAASPPIEEPSRWAEHAGLAWCDEPGVSAARVAWTDETAAEPPSSPRPPSVILPLAPRGRSVGEIHLWTGSDETNLRDHPALGAWSRWAGEVAAFRRFTQRLVSARASLQPRQQPSEPDRRQANLAALAEFAGGAGHELNNPLAVIVGRAQLLLAKQTEPDAIRSLRTIISQAQRTNRILRDLMYVARPPEPRPKLCQPDEILRGSIRDLQSEAEARSVRLVADLRSDPQLKVWTDPDPLRQIADCLIRNALEATPPGGRVFVTASGRGDRIEWSIRDEGRGVSESESIHLFDPFYCGRQAGRGLGMGLPRVARIIEKAQGELNWNSTPGRGTVFHLSVPCGGPPRVLTAANTEAENQERIA